MNAYALIAMVFTFISIFSGGLLAVRYRQRMGALTAFAGGVLIAMALFDLLPEAIGLASDQAILLAGVMGLIAVGFVFLFIVERSSPRAHTEPIRTKAGGHRRGGLLVTAELSVHGLLEGMAIGLGFGLDPRVGFVVAIAVICHEFSEGLSAVTAMLDTGNTVRTALGMLFLESISPALGVLLTALIPIPDYYLVLSLPFFAGGFLYMGALDLLPRAISERSWPVAILFGGTGFISIVLLSLMVG
jgi:ZIP family zinc transporter